jgi:hypothetical protein
MKEGDLVVLQIERTPLEKKSFRDGFRASVKALSKHLTPDGIKMAEALIERLESHAGVETGE